MTASSPSVAIIGGGIIGCATAYYLAREGIRATILERSQPAAEASGANAGMCGRLAGLEAGTLDFLRPSVDLLWRAAEELDERFDFRREGRLLLALQESDLPELRHLATRASEAGLKTELLDGPAVRSLEPALAETVQGGLLVLEDGQLDPVKTTNAFANTAVRLGARLETGVEVQRLEAQGGRVVGLRTSDGPRAFDQVVLAAGAWSGGLAQTVGLGLPVTPGKGQMLATEPLPRFSGRVLRGPAVGMRQAANGEIIIGSTVEDAGFDKTVVPATIQSHFERMAAAVPALRSARIGRSWAGLRPMTPDSLPIIQAAPDLDGLWLATGHSRTGMSYGPGTGRAIADLILRGRSSLPLEQFTLDRFLTSGASTPRWNRE